MNNYVYSTLVDWLSNLAEVILNAFEEDRSLILHFNEHQIGNRESALIYFCPLFGHKNTRSVTQKVQFYRYRGTKLSFSALSAVPGMPFRWIKPIFHSSSDSLADSNPEWFDAYDSQNQSQQMSPKHQTEFDFKLDFDTNWDY